MGHVSVDAGETACAFAAHRVTRHNYAHLHRPDPVALLRVIYQWIPRITFKWIYRVPLFNHKFLEINYLDNCQQCLRLRSTRRLP